MPTNKPRHHVSFTLADNDKGTAFAFTENDMDRVIRFAKKNNYTLTGLMTKATKTFVANEEKKKTPNNKKPQKVKKNNLIDSVFDGMRVD